MSIPAGQPGSERVRLTDSISIGVLARVVTRETVEEVLAETRNKEQRVRLMPAHVVVYFVMAMAVFQDGYEEVMRRLVGGLRFMRAWSDEWVVPSTAAITRARSRLGEAPMKELFGRVAEPLAHPATSGAWLGGRRLMAIDGVQIDVADTAANVRSSVSRREGHAARFRRPGWLGWASAEVTR